MLWKRAQTKYVYNDSFQLQMERRKISRGRSRFLDCAELGHFKFLLCRARQRNMIRFITQAHMQVLFCTLKRLFGDVHVSVVVVICLSLLIFQNWVSQSISSSISSFICPSVCPFVSLSVCLFIYLYTIIHKGFPSLWMCMNVHVSLCLSLCLQPWWISWFSNSQWIWNIISLFIRIYQLLKKAVEKYGACNWNKLSDMVPGRSGPQCRERSVTRVLQPQGKQGCLQVSHLSSILSRLNF